MLFGIVEACLHYNYFLFLRKLKDYFILLIEIKPNEKPAPTFRQKIREGNCYLGLKMANLVKYKATKYCKNIKKL